MLSEGGMFPWKVQRLKLPPSLSYDDIHRPLEAPQGSEWSFDPALKEWTLVAKEKEFPSIIVDASATMEDVEGNLFVSHHISSADTIHSICTRYKITPLDLRRANRNFTGNNLTFFPNPLMIPLKHIFASKVVAEEAEPLSQVEIVTLLLNECRGMSFSEARAYLMLNDWDLSEALGHARDDGF